jgi:hypothetical protein
MPTTNYARLPRPEWEKIFARATSQDFAGCPMSKPSICRMSRCRESDFGRPGTAPVLEL